VGKTTVVMKVVEGFSGRAGGFYTEEIRTGNTRQGFQIRTLDGRNGILAHVNHSGPFRVGKYGVDVEAFDEIALPSLERALEEDELVIIDKVLGVIHQRIDPYTQRIRHWPTVEIWTVTETNRDSLPSVILKKWAYGRPFGS